MGGGIGCWISPGRQRPKSLTAAPLKRDGNINRITYYTHNTHSSIIIKSWLASQLASCCFLYTIRIMIRKKRNLRRGFFFFCGALVFIVLSLSHQSLSLIMQHLFLGHTRQDGRCCFTPTASSRSSIALFYSSRRLFVIFFFHGEKKDERCPLLFFRLNKLIWKFNPNLTLI